MQTVGIHGAPRSGTSWLGQLFNSNERVAYRYQPFFSYAFQGRVVSKSSPAEVADFLDDLANTTDPFVLQRGAGNISARELVFDKNHPSHLVYKEVRHHELIETMLRGSDDFTCIGIVRSPIAALNSWYRAPREFKDSWDLSAEWRYAAQKNAERVGNFYGYEGWKRTFDILVDLRRSFPGRVKIVAYETLAERPLDTLHSLFDFCGLEMTRQTVDFVAVSRSSDDGDPYGVFRTGAVKTENALPDEACRWITDDLRRFGYEALLAGDPPSDDDARPPSGAASPSPIGR